jgi:putative ABC transport system substrate-binding protein
MDLRLKFSSLMIRLANERRLPLYAHRKEWVEQGGLISYSPDLGSIGTLAAGYVDKILRGAKPSDLPVQEFSQYKLVINLKTAKALGLALTPSLLARADQVIE